MITVFSFCYDSHARRLANFPIEDLQPHQDEFCCSQCAEIYWVFLHFQVSAGNGVNSSVFNFSTPPAVGAYPLRMGVFADVGQTFNSSETLRRLLDAGSSVLAFVGDWT